MTPTNTPTSGATDLPEALRLADAISDLLCSNEVAARTIAAAADELVRLHALAAGQATAAKPAAQQPHRSGCTAGTDEACVQRGCATNCPAVSPRQGVAYAELPDSPHILKETPWGTTGAFTTKCWREYPSGSGLYTVAQMRAFADATNAIRASHGQAPAPTHEQIAAYLESTGAYVTNDATREAAIAEAIDTDRAKRGQAPDLHPKTSDLVQRFAAALAEKLSAAEKKYGYSDGWASPNWMDECRQHLSAHIAKGDPRDVAAYCAFLWHHGATTASPQTAQPAPAEVSSIAGMNIPQRILHVGGRNNDAGYVEFGSIQAVEALVRQVLRDLPAQPPADSVPEDAARWNAWSQAMVEASSTDTEPEFLRVLSDAIGDAEPPITLQQLNAWTDAARAAQNIST